MSKLFRVSYLLSLALASSTCAARTPTVTDRLQAEYKKEAAALGRSPLYVDMVACWRKVAAKPEYATNAAARVYAADEIIKLCRMPWWLPMQRWDPALEHEIPVEAKKVLADPELKFADKVPSAAALACYQASELEDFKAAEATLDALRKAYPNATPKELGPLDMAYMSLYRWQDRYDDAWTALARAVAVRTKGSERSINYLGRESGDWERAHRLWATGPGLGLFAELMSYAGGVRPTDYLARAEAFARDAQQPLQQRAQIVAAFFWTDQSAHQRELRALVKEADFAKIRSYEQLLCAYQLYGNYALYLELEEFFKISYGEKTPGNLCRRHIIALAATGRRDEAAKFASARAALPNQKDNDLLRARLLEAILTGGDVAKVVDAANLKPIDAAAAWRTAARYALTMNETAAAEDCSGRYVAMMNTLPARRQTVKYFKTPILSVSDWRGLRGQLDPQLCDRKYGLSFEDLVTDVATGREEIKASKLDTDSARMELTTACDRNGLHIFLRVEDPNAYAVRDGFAGGISGETYLAPGRGEPYLCLGVSAARGVEYAFQTQYDNANATRPDIEHRKGDGFRIERAFTETDYTVHLFFDWETYASKIPVNGSVWRFGCNARSSKGGHTWGGSQGPHETSSWGDLVFELPPEAVTDIRRRLLCKAKGNWRKPGLVDTFDRWAASGRADPQFYAEVLAPLEKELAGLMDGVKPEMTDADVNRIFEQGYVRVRGLKHEIDRLRQDYLKRKLTD